MLSKTVPTISNHTNNTNSRTIQPNFNQCGHKNCICQNLKRSKLIKTISTQHLVEKEIIGHKWWIGMEMGSRKKSGLAAAPKIIFVTLVRVRLYVDLTVR